MAAISIVLFQPFEVMIIVGAAVGGFIISNRKPVLSGAGKAIPGLLKGEKYNKGGYLELLTLLYAVFKMAKTKGALVLEQHVEKPHESPLFQQYPALPAPTSTRSPSSATICASSPSAPTTITRWKR